MTSILWIAIVEAADRDETDDFNFAVFCSGLLAVVWWVFYLMDTNGLM